jgi:large subunit ribosomal protein L1
MAKTEKKIAKKAKKEVKTKILATTIEEAVSKAVENSQEKKRKFVESLDLSINLNIDAKQSDQNVRGSVLLPQGSGKKVRVAVFTSNEAKQKEALDAGAAVAGFEELVEKVLAGNIEFDYCIATPDIMSKIGKVAKVLGPRGLMPSPKNGSVTPDIKKAVEEALKGKVNFKNDKAGIVHCLVGKVDFAAEKLIENIKEVIKVIKESKPEAAKGRFIKKIHLSSTMGNSVEIALDSI